MSRNYANSKSRIRRMCALSELEEKNLYEKGKILLEIYRDVCWSAMQGASEVREGLLHYGVEDTPHADMDAAFLYLETFAPEDGKGRFEEQIDGLFDTRWMVDIIDAAMIKVREFPCYGELYYDLLHLCYMNRFTYTESEILQTLNMERSTFYRRKKEAIVVFGFAIWGAPFEEFRKFFKENTEPEYEQLSLL